MAHLLIYSIYSIIILTIIDRVVTKVSEFQQERLTIAELRAKRGKLSQAQLAEELGTNQTSVSMWEKDIMTISTKNLYKLCQYFGVSSNKILGW